MSVAGAGHQPTKADCGGANDLDPVAIVNRNWRAEENQGFLQQVVAVNPPPNADRAVADADQ
jgi:hypothetical protein